jgi:LSD1 subclass zinc finger protein
MFRRREKIPKVSCPSCGKPNEVPDGSGAARCILCNGILPVAVTSAPTELPVFEVVAAPARAESDEQFDFGALVVGAPGLPQPSSNDV